MKKTIMLGLCLLLTFAMLAGSGLASGFLSAEAAGEPEGSVINGNAGNSFLITGNDFLTGEPGEKITFPKQTPFVLPEDYKPDFSFSTKDISGEKWTESCFAEAELTMINFWEPWCPPCVGEMPDLERLYQDYRERGFQILGVYSTEENAATVIEETGVSYPILHYVPEFDVFQTGYVPTTVFVNRWGEIVGQTQIGGRNYAAWAEIVEGLL